MTIKRATAAPWTPQTRALASPRRFPASPEVRPTPPEAISIAWAQRLIERELERRGAHEEGL